MLANSSSAESVVDTYYNTSFTGSALTGGPGVGVVNQLFMHSIAHPAIAYYQRVLGPARVLVISADDLEGGPGAAAGAMDRVFAFLGVAPFDVVGSVDLAALRAASVASAASSATVLQGREMTQQGYLRLTRFFAPFILELQRTAGLNLTSWIARPAPPTLPLVPLTAAASSARDREHASGNTNTDSNGNGNGNGNASHVERADRPASSLRGGAVSEAPPTPAPTMWFELERAAAVARGGIISHLLPKTKAQGDTGYNTSIGMFNAF